MENELTPSFKDKLHYFVKLNGVIKFDVYLHHKGHVVELPDLGEFKDELEEWLAYDGLANYLVSQEIYYRFSGSIFIKNDDIKIGVQFFGPYDEEFEIEKIDFDESFLSKVVLDSDLKVNIDYFNSDEFFVHFEYYQGEGFRNFSAEYYFDDVYIDSYDIFNEQQINELKNICERHVLRNVPTLNVFQDLDQYWDATCDQGVVKYSIHTGIHYLNFDDI